MDVGINHMFMYTYSAVIDKINFTHKDLISLLKPCDGVLALNSNYGSSTQNGYEHLIKTKQRDTKRKVEGNGTCFNSAIQAHLKITDPTISKQINIIKENKIYNIKYFPTTGSIQIPGGILPDKLDCRQVVKEWTSYINSQLNVNLNKVSDNIIMLNTKCRINYDANKYTLCLEKIAELFKNEESYDIREVKGAINNTKASCKLYHDKGKTRINIFISGKVNLLGAPNIVAANIAYEYIKKIISNDNILCNLPSKNPEDMPDIPRFTGP